VVDPLRTSENLGKKKKGLYARRQLVKEKSSIDSNPKERERVKKKRGGGEKGRDYCLSLLAQARGVCPGKKMEGPPV